MYIQPAHHRYIASQYARQHVPTLAQTSQVQSEQEALSGLDFAKPNQIEVQYIKVESEQDALSGTLCKKRKIEIICTFSFQFGFFPIFDLRGPDWLIPERVLASFVDHTFILLQNPACRFKKDLREYECGFSFIIFRVKRALFYLNVVVSRGKKLSRLNWRKIRIAHQVQKSVKFRLGTDQVREDSTKFDGFC